MTVLKPAEVVALDDVTRAGQELTERLDTIVALQRHDDEVWRMLERHGERIAGKIDELCELRRLGGDLPAGGNVERAELGAVAAKARTLFSSEAETPQIAAMMIREYRALRDLVETARAAVAADHPLSDSLRELNALLDESEEGVQGVL